MQDIGVYNEWNGGIHEMLLEAYDPTRTGYHSPDFPHDCDRLLVKPEPWE